MEQQSRPPSGAAKPPGPCLSRRRGQYREWKRGEGRWGESKRIFHQDVGTHFLVQFKVCQHLFCADLGQPDFKLYFDIHRLCDWLGPSPLFVLQVHFLYCKVEILRLPRLIPQFLWQSQVFVIVWESILQIINLSANIGKLHQTLLKKSNFSFKIPKPDTFNTDTFAVQSYKQKRKYHQRSHHTMITKFSQTWDSSFFPKRPVGPTNDCFKCLAGGRSVYFLPF